MKNLILSLLLALCTPLVAVNVGNPVTVYPSGTPIPVSGSFSLGTAYIGASITAVSAGVSITVNNTSASAIPVVVTNTSIPVTGAITSAGNVSLNAGTSVIGSLGTAGNVSLNAGTSFVGYVGVTGNASTVTYFAMNAVTYASSVAGTSMQYLTISPSSALLLSNVTAGTLYYVLTNSSTAPTNTSTIRNDLASNEKINLNVKLGTLVPGYNFLHWINANVLTPTAQLSY